MRELLRSLTKISDEYREKYMKIKFNSGDELPLNKMKEIHSNSSKDVDTEKVFSI